MRSMIQLGGWGVGFENERVFFESEARLISKVKRDIP